MTATNTSVNRAWPHRPLADVAEVFLGLSSGRRMTSAETRADSLPLINVRDLDNGRVARLDRLEARTVSQGSRVDRYRVRTGDVLVTCRGAQLKVAHVTDATDGAIISSNLLALRVGPELLAPVLFAILQSAPGQAALLDRNRSSSLSLALSPNSVGRIVVPIPPLDVQRRIADLVRAAEDNHEAAIRAAQQRRALAHAVALGLLQGAAPRGRTERE